jgi:uncharacterized membrane protein
VSVPPGRHVGTNRLSGFSDGVFSIAITLLVLDLPVDGEGSALDRVIDAWPYYVAYFVTFATIGAAWLSHVMITDRLERADGVLLRLNLLVLLVVGFLPYPTRVAAGGLVDGAGERLFITLYGVTMFALRLLLFALDKHARHEGLMESGERDDVGRTFGPIAVGYAVAIGAGFVVPKAAVVGFCVLAVVLLIPARTLAGIVSRLRPGA